MDPDTNSSGGISAGVTVDDPMPDTAPSSSNDVQPFGVHESSEIPPENQDVSQDDEQEEGTQEHTSKVNGLGMWSAWERNFSNKLKACLDLVDNAVDAALWDSDDEDEDEREQRGRPLTERERWKKQSGNIHVSTEKHRLALEYYDSDDDEEEEEEIEGGHRDEDGGNNLASPNPQPFLVHDIIGAGRPNTAREDPDAGETTDDFRLIDDENTLCLHNDCVNPVKELRKILDVYNSDKADSAIGENGVGVKQAAAAMSDLSIVVTTRIDEEPLVMDYDDIESRENSSKRIRKVLVSIGVLAKKMQTKDACTIPSWTLPIEFDIDEQSKKKPNGRTDRNGGNTSDTDGNDEEDEDEDEDLKGNTCVPILMQKLINITNSSYLFGKVMKEFGGAAAKKRRKYGMRRLAKHIELMIVSTKKKGKALNPPHPHQYLMILHKFGKHKSKAKNDQSEGEKNAAIIKARNDLDDLLRDLADEMPRTYLHIPPAPYFKFRVNRKLLKFQYWERNLVELHRIPLVIDRRNDFRTAEDWLVPENDDDTYDIQVAIGFDPSRANPSGGQASTDKAQNFTGGQACSLLIFSRISGRLFLNHDDARGVLRLQNSGTNFCQGLTIIVDDYEGHLPLTPTKESLAFGMEDYGKIHERNLYAWLGALASAYWNHFYNTFKTKRALGNAVKNQLQSVNQLKEKRGSDLPTLRFGKFSTVEKLYFSRERMRGAIRPYRSESTRWTYGPSTLISLSDPKPKKKPKAATKKRKVSDVLEGHNSGGNDPTGAVPADGLSEKAAGEDDVENLPERLDGRPRRATKEPVRFKVNHTEAATSSRKKRYKPISKDVEGADELLMRKLRELQDIYAETQVELNASKATCDDLQIQLDEAEQEASNRIFDLETKLEETESRHEVEMQRLEEDYMKQLEASRAQIRELEEKKA